MTDDERFTHVLMWLYLFVGLAVGWLAGSTVMYHYMSTETTTTTTYEVRVGPAQLIPLGPPVKASTSSI